VHKSPDCPTKNIQQLKEVGSKPTATPLKDQVVKGQAAVSVEEVDG